MKNNFFEMKYFYQGSIIGILLSMKPLYKDILLDHYRNPRNQGTLENYNFANQDSIPSCGDSISMQGVIKDNVLRQIVFLGSGCVISQATASLLTEYALGKTIEQILVFSSADIQELIGMQLGPIRLKCALLPLYVLQQGIKKYVTSCKNVAAT